MRNSVREQGSFSNLWQHCFHARLILGKREKEKKPFYFEKKQIFRGDISCDTKKDRQTDRYIWRNGEKQRRQFL